MRRHRLSRSLLWLTGLILCTSGCHLIFPFSFDTAGSSDANANADADPAADAGPGRDGRTDGAAGCGPFGATCPTLTGLALGERHSCARDATGRVWCWGANVTGQLGDGSRIDRNRPTPVAITGVGRLAAGTGHTCAVTKGGVSCWGDNRSGQAGAEAATAPVLLTPTPVLLVAVDQLALGDQHSCVRAAGKVRCWGGGWSGQLGAGDSQDSTRPRAVKGLGNSSDLCCGHEHCCALVSGEVMCWGGNSHRQLGTVDLKMRNAPVKVVGLAHSARRLSCGEQFSCAILDDGTTACWGDNQVKQLGDGPSASSSAPVLVKGLASTTALAPGYGHNCALSATHALRCWGYNRYGQVGVGEGYSSSSGPQPPRPGWEVTQIAAGAYHTCALARGDGSLWCWGNNGQGQQGNGRFARRAKPAAVTTLGAVAQLAAGGHHTCALLQGGTVSCWGYNSQGQLGDGTGTPLDQATPAKVASLTGATTIGGGGLHSCAVAGGKVRCWGAGWSGQLGSGGSGNSSDKPLELTGLGGSAIAVVGGHDHGCALLTDQTVRCWGSNKYGQLGHDSGGTGVSGPVQVKGLTAVIKLSARSTSTCALRSDGTIWCWGDNASGQLGDGSRTARRAPVKVTGPSNAKDVALGGHHACAVDGLGAVWCWGKGRRGQLGDGSVGGAGSLKAQPVAALGPKIKEVTAGWRFSCALDEAGSVWCWGANSTHQLGKAGWSGPLGTPTQLIGLAAESLTAGWSHICARLKGGEARCWGYAFFGQLGDGVKAETWVPRRVMP